ncbi:hypothetical protein P3X46_015257 [Hevea brasiliensis]|uniref:Phytocyanin domain-containing protein n=1 Tax=Hevea brasiliensis TaxID=3981 RepID=A0ABQ9LWN7_HEVBR|nr:mavicyanin-like [Hevea brasiliensis]KAJ9171963.1 hypothetical protein P3X46_015257 [Hevea brasiliensis]
MASVNIAVILILVAMALYAVSVAMAATYMVGDSAGWTLPQQPIYYDKWAADKTFVVGDTLVFDYNPQYHNVLRVDQLGFQSCNATSPIMRYASGRDSVALQSPGHFFFLCGFPGHCQAGQKVHIHIAIYPP